jgi:arylsulfatase A-like enzyme
MLDIPMRVAAWDGSAEHELWQARLPAYHETWRDVHVPLDRFAGRSVRLRFSSRPGAGADQGVLGVFGEPIVTASRHATAPAPHVILISIDTLRAASVGAYGSAAPTTPTLDALAADGVLFENAFSTAAFTLPGHMSMFSGLWVRTHRAINFFSMLPLARRTLPELLQSAGFALGASTSGAWIIPGLGFRRGFDLYHERGPTPHEELSVPVPYACFTRGLAWLRQNRDRPTFLFVHSYQAHAPYLAPPPYDRLFGEALPDAPDAERLRQRYERAIRYADDQLRAFLEGLDALGLRDSTLVIVTADHGEAFGEHGMFQHTHDVHDEIARVPLVMRLPGVAVPGRRVTEPVSIADIAPTVLDVLGLPAIPEADGESLLPLLTGAADRLPRDAVFTEAESEPYLGWTDLTAAHTRTMSCIDDARRGTQECWDRRFDPWQLGAPLRADAASPEIAATKAALVRFFATRPPAGTPQPEGDGNSATPGAVDPERREQLRTLGYVE